MASRQHRSKTKRRPSSAQPANFNGIAALRCRGKSPKSWDIGTVQRPPALLSSDEGDGESEVELVRDSGGEDNADSDTDCVGVAAAAKNRTKERRAAASVGFNKKRRNATSSALSGVDLYFGSRHSKRRRDSNSGSGIAFSAGSGSRSKRTLADLQMPSDRKEVQDLILTVPMKHSPEIHRLHQAYEYGEYGKDNRTGRLVRKRDGFRQFWWQLRCGFNLLFYGFGSKRAFLERFVHSWSDYRSSWDVTIQSQSSSLSAAPKGLGQKRVPIPPCVLVVNGFSPAANVRELAYQVTRSWLGYEGSFRTLNEHFDFISRSTGADPPPQLFDRSASERHGIIGDAHDQEGGAPFISQDLVVLIHNIDGEQLRKPGVQSALSVLASTPRVHVVASVDHVHAALLWDQRESERFNWVWHDATTYICYSAETVHAPPVVGGRDAVSSRGAAFVLQSLTPNHISVLKVLAEHQLRSSAGSSGVRGMDFTELYNRCRDEMLVSSDNTLKRLLVEFTDHHLISSRRTSSDGKELLYISLPVSVIEKEILGFRH